MPQVFGADQIGLVHFASLWVEAETLDDIRRATHGGVAAEATKRGLEPLRMGGNGDPIWHHPTTGKIISLTPAHSGEAANYTSMGNLMAKLKRDFPTAEETARASRTPEEVDADAQAAAQETRARKQEAVDAAKRARQQEFLRQYSPFASMDEIQRAFDSRSPKAKAARPDDTVDAFASRLSALPKQTRRQVHQTVFPERYQGG